METKNKKHSVAFIVQGRVQGVGFRPFVWRLATELGLAGYVRNTSAGVRIDVAGLPQEIDQFEKRLIAEQPPLAQITSVRKEAIPSLSCNDFTIGHSQGHGGQNVLVSPDMGICADCLEDIRNPANPRHAYAFTSCVNCGPRYSITKSIPYDRPGTVMACFAMCENCAAEYSSPADRRFHAQPIACPVCGPRIWFVAEEDIAASSTALSAASEVDALEKAGKLILAGGILALKGLGGFQLACDARNDKTVALLRQRKKRPHKAFALMAASMEAARIITAPAEAHERLLQSVEKPVVLCPRASGCDLSPLIAPDAPHLGIMLPNTPLHALLLDWLGRNGMENPVLVMTSANPSGEPICLGNREAIGRLAHLADGFLFHNRDILARVDDSVVAVPDIGNTGEADPVFIRRARGYVPVPVQLPACGKDCSILGAGAQLKATFCITRGEEAFTGQHTGDLETAETMEFYTSSLRHMLNLLETEPQAIVHDLHPDFLSTSFARELAQKCGIPAWPLQHHAAHAAAVLAENNCYRPALALCLDGTGLGDDGNIWGGELLAMDLRIPVWSRKGSLRPFPLPGGEMAIRQPWRIALAFDHDLEAGNPKERQMTLEMLRKNFRCPMTSSCGRLFDAVAAMAGLCDAITYEGQAAMRLTQQAAEWIGRNRGKTPFYDSVPLFTSAEIPQVDSHALFASCQTILRETGNISFMSASFHFALANALTRLCAVIAKKTGLVEVGLSGGVMQNGILAWLLPKELKNAGLKPLSHKILPPGDGGLSLGQAVWGRQKFFARENSGN